MSEANSASWDQLINEQQGTYSDAQERNDWLPPAGMTDLHAIVSDVTSDTYVGKDGKTYPYWRVTGTMLDGVDPVTGKSFESRTFTLAFLTTGPLEFMAGQMKSFARWLTGGEEVADLRVADQLIRGATGRFQFTFDVKAGKKGATFIKVTACQDLQPPAAAPSA